MTDETILPFRSPVQEHHIDFLLEEEFLCNAEFLPFFLRAAQEHYRGREEDRALLSVVSSPCQAVRSATDADGETDVLVVYNSSTAGRVAILIENKLRARFQPDQAARYRRRGESGRGRQWDHVWTCLIAPDGYAAGNQEFDTRISIDELAKFFRGEAARFSFKAHVLERVSQRYDETGLQVRDEVMTRFRAFYAEQAAAFFAAGEVIWPPPRDAWRDDTWFNYRGGPLPKGVEVVHKARPGHVDLVFQHSNAGRLAELLEAHLAGAAAAVIQTGKSASVRLRVDDIVDFSDGEAVVSVLKSAFEAVRRLLHIYREHADMLSCLEQGA